MEKLKNTPIFSPKESIRKAEMEREWMLMMIYNTGTRSGLIATLIEMQKELNGRDRNLRKWTKSILEKLASMSDEDFNLLDFFPDQARVEVDYDDKNCIL